MTSVLGNEFFKTFRRWRSYIGFIAIGAVVPLVEIGLKADGGSLLNAVAGAKNLPPEFMILGNLFNGYTVTLFIMNSLWLHIPFLISLVAGDQLAGEAAGGTFRLLLTRPPSRGALLFSKYVVTLAYTAMLVLFLVALSLGLGVFLLGTGDLAVPGKQLAIVSGAEAPWRFFLALLLAIWSMWCVASLAFFFSSLTENSIGPIIGSMAVIIVFIVISNVPISIFLAVRPFLFTTYLNVWLQAMGEPIPWGQIASSAASLGAYSAALYLATWWHFGRKDIVT
jgi:ABC-2 type transport system permease protein